MFEASSRSGTWKDRYDALYVEPETSSFQDWLEGLTKAYLIMFEREEIAAAKRIALKQVA